MDLRAASYPPWVAAKTVLPSGATLHWIVPAHYRPQTWPVILWHHGRSATGAELFDVPYTQIMIPLLAAGYLLIAPSLHGDNFGNAVALADVSDAYTTLAARLPLGKTIHLGGSMGGLSSLLAYLADTVPNAVGWIGIGPLVNLHAAYWDHQGFSQGIYDAYHMTDFAQSSDYDAKTAGHDPCALPPAAFAGKRLRVYASPDDTTVPQGSHADVLMIRASAAAECTLVPCVGEHGDVSHFQGADLVATCDRWAA
jgi:pimeloyl-ACP methyl ester carboxylesterase